MAAVGETAAQIGLRERERKAAERRLRERGVCGAAGERCLRELEGGGYM
jgi:hypothetical protein